MLPMISLNDVSLSYHSVSGETKAVSHLSFSVSEGEFVTIVGPSGCGKSSILSMLAGLLPPSGGSISVNGNIGYMLQKDHLLEWRTIRRNAQLGLELQGKLTAENIAFVDRMLEQYGLAEFKDRFPAELSGGMRQRAALIRTLAVRPDILLLDEPFSALDYQTRLSVADEIGTIIRKEGKTALLVSHDISEAISLSDRVLVLSGRPARLKKIHDIQLSVENRTPMKAREAPEFRDYFNTIWKELDVHVA
ncbi:MAG TPA: ABC transporter ATP-binding protein [Candidatus Anaerotignum merdipullorum]|nr:ABC transporter ATP-binding protein [Candidatus Anaerotignum merdipullorum]